MSKLLALDLDGTLFYPKQVKRCIPKKNANFIRRWIDAGNRVVFISSRSYDFCSQLEKEIGRPCDFMSSSSAQIVANGELIRDASIPFEDLHGVLKDIEEKFQPLGILTQGKERKMHIKVCVPKLPKFVLWAYYVWWFFQFKYREGYQYYNASEYEEFLKTEPISKVIIFYGIRKNKAKISKEINKELRDKYNSIEFSWTAQVNELTPKNCNKSEGLKIYCNHLNINKEDVYVVGDSGNDISMFNDFHEHSFCMKHSYPSVKKYASHVISRVYKLEKYVLKGEK